MKQRQTSGRSEDVSLLLTCLHKGLSPSIPRSYLKRWSISPKNKMLPGTLKQKEVTVVKSSVEDGFITPKTKNLKLMPFSKEVSPGIFYGSPVGKRGKRPPQVLRLLHEIRRDLAAEGYSFAKDTIWVTFAKQDQAIQFVQGHGRRDIAVFTYQDHFSGQRRFLATTYNEFWNRYEKIPQDHRHHYEIITEGSPCHLYFDLEFDRIANKGLDGNLLVDLLLLKISEALHDIYCIEYDSSWVMELDSTTEEKFSRHIIIQIPKAAFKNNSHVGAFVSEICNRIDKDRSSDDCLNNLYVLKGHSRGDCTAQLFVDQAVYSRNRSFRLPFSSKAGKSSRLLPTGRFHCKEMNDHEVFGSSLICCVGSDCEKLLTFGEMNRCGGSMTCNASESLSQNGMAKDAKFSASGKSPFPDVDMFIESIACIEGIPGKIRSWYWFSDYGVLVYNIIGNRYCENIGRQHKSNHVMYIVDFRTAGYYQKCHDPDCRGYRSQLRPIPQHYIPSGFHPYVSSEVSLDTAAASVNQADFSAQIFSSLSIRNDTAETFENISQSWSESDNEENAWWEEAFNSIEGNKDRSNTSEQSIITTMMVGTTDDWWELLGKELESQGI